MITNHKHSTVLAYTMILKQFQLQIFNINAYISCKDRLCTTITYLPRFLITRLMNGKSSGNSEINTIFVVVFFPKRASNKWWPTIEYTIFSDFIYLRILDYCYGFAMIASQNLTLYWVKWSENQQKNYKYIRLT